MVEISCKKGQDSIWNDAIRHVTFKAVQVSHVVYGKLLAAFKYQQIYEHSIVMVGIRAYW